MKKNCRLFAQKLTPLEQFLSIQEALSDIRDFSKIMVFKDFGGHIKIHATGTISFFICQIDTHIFLFHHCLEHHPS